MKTRLLLCALGFLLLAACTSCHSPSYLDNANTTRDARVAADKYWKTGLTQCGEYSYSGESVITVYKDFDFTLRDLSVSEDDRQGGVEWRMRTAIKPGTPYRVWDPDRKQWGGDWGNVGVNGASLVFENRNGTVNFSEGPDGFKAAKIDCSSAPK